jgi:hypothetical protein
MMQWHWRQWLLWPMVAATIMIIILNCPVAVDVTANIPSMALTAAAKTPSLPPPSTAASIGDDFYHSC